LIVYFIFIIKVIIIIYNILTIMSSARGKCKKRQLYPYALGTQE
jgi:hypothetical protein